MSVNSSDIIDFDLLGCHSRFKHLSLLVLGQNEQQSFNEWILANNQKKDPPIVASS